MCIMKPVWRVTVARQTLIYNKLQFVSRRCYANKYLRFTICFYYIKNDSPIQEIYRILL